MPRQITGFADDCWKVLDDGRVVRRAMNNSYKEHLLSGVSIEDILDKKMNEEFLARKFAEMPIAPRAFNIWTVYWSSKPLRPDFLEPTVIRSLTCGRCRSKLKKEWEYHTCLAWTTCNDCGLEFQVNPENDDHICIDSQDSQQDDDTSVDDYFMPSVVRNHRGKPKKVVRRKQPKHEPKVQKNSTILARGKIRIDSVLPTNTFKAELEWEKNLDEYMSNVIDKLRWGEKRYRWDDIDSIVQRFESALEPGDNIEKKWLTLSPSIIQSYTPLANYSTRRYFEWDDDDDDWDWIDKMPVRIYW